MAKAYMLIGLPAVGKSTWMEAQGVPGVDFLVASSDMFIEGVALATERTYNDVFNDKDIHKRAKASMNESIRAAGAEQRDLIWDQTNLTKKSRARKIHQLRVAGFDRIEAVFFWGPRTIDEAFEWNRRLNSRPGKVIPNRVLHDMLAMEQAPSLSEGFDSIVCIDLDGKPLVQ